MTNDSIIKGINKFIKAEIEPNATPTEKSILMANETLDLLGLNSKIEALKAHPMLAASKAFDSQGELDLYALKSLAIRILNEQYGGSYMYKGKSVDLIFTTATVFAGYKITPTVIDTLFEYIIQELVVDEPTLG